MLGLGDDSDQASTTASDLADGSGESGSDLPADQADFLGAVAAGQAAADGANELQVVEARERRAVAMCEVLGENLRVTNWVGVVDSLDTTLGGDSAVLDLLVAEDVRIGTWNNGFSDLGSGSLIDPGSALWDQVTPLEERDQVYFSGRFNPDARGCLTETSMMDENGRKTPSFVFVFSEVGPKSDGPLTASSRARSRSDN